MRVWKSAEVDRLAVDRHDLDRRLFSPARGRGTAGLTVPQHRRQRRLPELETRAR